MGASGRATLEDARRRDKKRRQKRRDQQLRRLANFQAAKAKAVADQLRRELADAVQLG